jgi:hypothetical protein
MGGAHPLGLDESRHPGSEHDRRWKIERNHPLDWEKTLNSNVQNFQNECPFLDFYHSKIVSNFGFRASNLILHLAGAFFSALPG